jgi:hypothetical protein
LSGSFSFAPNSQVAETLPPDPVQTMSMNGWTFSAKPITPFQKKFKVTLHGMRWYLLSDGLYDSTTAPTMNARALELFYEANGTWDNFTYLHPHLGSLTCRFAAAVTVPAAIPNSGGLIGPLEVTLVHHNPGY